MIESIEIKYFGPIRHIVIDDIKPLTVFIGDSGSGKSIIMKVLSLFRWMYKRANLRSYIRHAQIGETKIVFNIKALMKTSGILEYLTDKSVIVYRRGPYELRMEKYSIKAQQCKVKLQDLCIDKICFISDKRAMISDIVANKAERRIANYYLADTLENFEKAAENIPEMDLNFLNVKFRRTKSKNGLISYKLTDLSGDHYDVSLRNASSGMQNITPVEMIIADLARHYDPEENMRSALFKYMAETDNLKYFNPQVNIGDIADRTIHVLIEEPELSLYPSAQRSAINHIIKEMKQSNINMTLTIATHSPYIINHLNLLMLAAEKDTLIEGASVSYDNLAVYAVANGTLEDLKVKNAPLINTDHLSDDINHIYDEYEALNQL